VFFGVFKVSAEKKPKKILILHSYNQGLSWTDELNTSITRRINADTQILPDFRIEYMDSKHFESETYFQQFYQFFLGKYRTQQFDILISTDDAAFNFLSAFRDSLPGKPPVVFCGLNNVDEIPENFTGILEDIDIYSNLNIIVKIHPHYKKLYFVVDRTITGNIIRAKAEQIIAQSFPALRHEFLTDYSFEELKTKLATLSDGDLVLLTTFNIDKLGNPVSYDHILELITPTTRVPIYGTWDFYLNKGIVGGKITKAASHGKLTAEVALRILNGTPADSIPVKAGPTEFIFDNNYVKRHGIAKSRIPEEAKIFNSPYSFIKENILWVVLMSVLFLLMLLVILVLVKLFNKEKQIRKKEQLFNQEIRNKSIELEIALQQAEKSNQLKTAFLSNLSHEIRTPMNAIVGFSDLLVSNSGDKKLEEYVTIIRASSAQLLSIINDIIEMSMIDTNQVHLHFGPMNVNLAIKEVCSSFIVTMDRDSKVTVKQNLPQGSQDIKIISDEVKFRQVLSNLISNALKFTESGYIEVGYFLSGGFLEFYVKDTGIGIDPKHHEEIFERFWRVEHTDFSLFRGLGIGLTLSRSFVKLMGGNIWLHSEPEKGSTFYFTIPYKQAVTKNDHPGEPEIVDFKNQIILICEDDENNLYYFKELFSKTSTFILWAKTGKEAVKICSENPNIDLVLMDLKMPEMNGWEATRIIKSMRPDLPVIAQTAHALAIETSQLNTKGFDDFVTKPIKKSELFEKIFRYMNQL
jgi:signal transduction histidine kinase